MKIENSSILMGSSHGSYEHDTVQERLRTWVGNQQLETSTESQVTKGQASLSGAAAAFVSLSDLAKATMQAAQNTPQVTQPAPDVEETETDPATSFLLKLLEAMLGRKINTVKIRKLHSDDNNTQQLQNIASSMAAMQAGANPQAAPASGQPQGWGLEYNRSSSHYEAEQTDFSAQGVIKTADGQSLEFNVHITMQREFQSSSNTSIRAGDALLKDPLVINFSGTAADLSSAKFAFDLDSDGKKDKISFVGPGSGFLALDLNMNGKVDNGSELFGTKNGNGFADLAQHDSDKNGWIDENDSIFNKLRVWAKDNGGLDSLYTLQQLHVGALYLGSTSTEFSAKNTANQFQGQVRSSGVYLKEDGSAGTLQQVDLAI